MSGSGVLFRSVAMISSRRFPYIRMPEVESVIFFPVVKRIVVSRMELPKVRMVSLRFSSTKRLAITRSAPSFSIFSSIRGMYFGSCCPSASIWITAS